MLREHLSARGAQSGAVPCRAVPYTKRCQEVKKLLLQFQVYECMFIFIVLFYLYFSSGHFTASYTELLNEEVLVAESGIKVLSSSVYMYVNMYENI